MATEEACGYGNVAMKKTKAITLALLGSLPGLGGCGGSSTSSETQDPDRVVEEYVPGPPPPEGPEMVVGSAFPVVWALGHPGYVETRTVHAATGQTTTHRSHYYGRRDGQLARRLVRVLLLAECDV